MNQSETNCSFMFDVVRLVVLHRAATGRSLRTTSVTTRLLCLGRNGEEEQRVMLRRNLEWPDNYIMNMLEHLSI